MMMMFGRDRLSRAKPPNGSAPASFKNSRLCIVDAPHRILDCFSEPLPRPLLLKNSAGFFPMWQDFRRAQEIRDVLVELIANHKYERKLHYARHPSHSDFLLSYYSG